MKNELIAIKADVVALDGRMGVTPSKIANETVAVISAEITTKTPGAASARRPAISSNLVPTEAVSSPSGKFDAVKVAILVQPNLNCALYATLCGRITTNSVTASSHHISKLK